jgi:hypothetical protein
MGQKRSSIDFGRYAVTAAAVGIATSANADFSSPYSLNPPADGVYSNPAGGSTFGAWTLSLAGPNGRTVDTSAAPTSLTLSMNDGSGVPASATLATTAISSGLLAFHWSANLSHLGGFGPAFAAVVINGVETDLTTADGTHSGDFSVAINAGDTFGFRVGANYVGSSAFTISNFSTPVPEPTVIALVVAGAVGLIALREARRRARAQKDA